jgi:four helix bundle protein
MIKNEKIKSFEELNVYKQARCLTNVIYEISKSGVFAKDFGLRDQIQRAAVSIMSNIAEGFERGSNTEFVQFLYIAKGSCGEIKAQITVALDQKYIDAVNYKVIVNDCDNIGGMLRNLIKYLQSSSYTGMKFKK